MTGQVFGGFRVLRCMGLWSWAMFWCFFVQWLAEYIIITIHADILLLIGCDFVAAVVSLALVVIVYVMFGSVVALFVVVVVVRSLGGPLWVGMPLDSSNFCATMFFFFRVTMSDVSFSWPQPALINSKPAVFPPCPQGESLSRCPGVAPFQAIILPRLGPLAAVHRFALTTS